MNSASTSIKAFGIYMILIPGLGMMAIPGIFLDLFGLSHGNYLWMARIIGLLAFFIGIYYIYFTKYELTQLYKISIIGRYFAALFMASLWVFGEVEIMILLFAAVDAAGATWTMLTLNNSRINDA